MFSFKMFGRATVALRKYLISASPGKPLRVGGRGRLKCPGGGLAISTLIPETLMAGAAFLSRAHAALKGICLGQITYENL